MLDNSEIRRLFAQAVVESFRQGMDANVAGAMMLVRPWGFPVEEVTFTRIFLWHGEQDRAIPVAPVRRLADALPHCTATFYPDTGHLSTLTNHAQDILKNLIVER